MARLVPIRHDNDDFRRVVRPLAVPAAREPGQVGDGNNPEDTDETGRTAKPAAGRPVRMRHAARHARTSDLRPRSRNPLSIRSAERRRWAADLTGPGSGGLVVYGIGGIGKSTLAAQIAARVSRIQSGRAINAVNGEVSAASFAAGPAETDFIILDDFDDNLSRQAGQWTVRDPALAALLASWPGKLLITCRQPFTLGEQAGRLAFRQLGPLTHSGAAELTTSLPALRLLSDAARDQVWRLTAGHPLAMEYLDRLLARGKRFDDVAGAIEAVVKSRTGQPLPRTEPTELPGATAELIACAAGDQMFGELFDRLGTGARSLLVRASVFRVPVAAEVLAARPGHIAECQAAGLLTIGAGHELTVHRWTAGELHGRLAEVDGAQVAAAHRQAAGYWLSRAAASVQSQRAELEAAYHQRRAAELARAPEPPTVSGFRSAAGLRRRKIVRYGVVGALAALAVVLAGEAGHELWGPHLASAESAARPASPVTEATVARDQAAAWVASQVSVGAILACDPAMCAALAAHGVAAGNLLVLRSGAGDPLGSDVVLATAAVRGIFGARLASVYAPELLASFGTGAARVDVRIVAPDGAAAYQTALAADVRARQAAGAQLLRDSRITVTPSARAELAAGQVDARLLITLAALAASEPFQVADFGAAGPGDSWGLPLRTAQLAAPAATARAMLAFVRAQRSPYLPAQAALTPAAPPTPGTYGESVLTVEFAAPAPLGLLQTSQ
jgi:hypothetical protein